MAGVRPEQRARAPPTRSRARRPMRAGGRLAPRPRGVSTRAARRAWIVDGTSVSPPSASVATSCSTNRGFPSAMALIRACSLARRDVTSPSRPSISCSASSSPSGSSVIELGVRSAASPRRALVEELRASETDEAERRVARPVGQVLDQVEERRLGPVDVLDDERQRPLAARAARVTCRRSRKTSSGRLGRRARPRVLLGIGGGEDLAQRPVADPLAVGKTPSRENDRVVAAAR